MTYLNMAGIVKEMNMFNWWTFYRNQPEEKKNSRIHDRTLRRRLSPLADGDLKDKFGIKPVTENRVTEYHFDPEKKEVVKFLSFPENHELYEKFDIPTNVIRKLRANKNLSTITPQDKFRVVEAFEFFMSKEQELGKVNSNEIKLIDTNLNENDLVDIRLDDKITEKNEQFFWEYIRERNKSELELKMKSKREDLYSFNELKKVLDYRNELLRLIDNEDLAETYFEQFIGLFTEFESVLLSFCEGYFAQKIEKENLHKANYERLPWEYYDVNDYLEDSTEFVASDEEDVVYTDIFRAFSQMMNQFFLEKTGDDSESRDTI